MNVFGVACALAFSLVAVAAEGHGRLVRTVPAAGSVLQEAPVEIRLVFEAAVVPALSGISITAEGGREWTAPASAVPGEDAQIVVRLPEPLMPGVFRVRWHALSADMHKAEGDFVFEVAP